MQLFPEGSLRRKIFDTVDRALGSLFFGEHRWVSALMGDRLLAGTAKPWQRSVASLIDACTMEYGHCLKNAGKP